MFYKEEGFRPFYHHFIAVPMREDLRKALQGFPKAEEATCFLTYGYIDREQGLSLEILAAAQMTERGFRFAEGNDEIRSMVRISAVEEENLFYFTDEDGVLAKRFAKKIEMLHQYDASEDVEKSRDMRFLDSCRHQYCIDDVLVHLMKDGLEPEKCWVRITGLGEHWFIGTLLNEPDQDFGYHEGESIAFLVQETEDKDFICISDMNPSRRLTEEDLADGSMLEKAVTAFNDKRTRENFVDILEILRDSWVWVPCTAVMSEADQKRFEEFVKSVGDDLDALTGQQFTAHDETRLIPDILQNGENYYFPIFSTADAMGEYGEHFSKVQKHMLEVIPLARNNDRKPVGIVLNAFTEPFVLDEALWEAVENMKSRIG